jgi:hypothetical protein
LLNPAFTAPSAGFPQSFNPAYNLYKIPIPAGGDNMMQGAQKFRNDDLAAQRL